MRQSYILSEQVKQSIIWIKLAFSSSSETPLLLETSLLLETLPSSSETLPSSSETLPSSLETLSLSLRTLPKDILLIIFGELDMRSMTEVIITCKYFKSIWEFVPKPRVCIYPIVLKNDVVDWQLLRGFEYSLKYISRDLKLRSLSEFKLVVVSEGKTESSLEYPMKAALLVQDDNLEKDELQLLESFVSQYSQTIILFLADDKHFSRMSKLYQSLRTLHSLEYICISNGHLGTDWPNLFNQFKRLKQVYFTPNEQYDTETKWTINTPKTVFIMDYVSIEPLSGNIK
jgi:hypothetical protein